MQRVEERSILAGNRVHHTALILQELAVYEKEPASVVKVTEEGDLNIMANDIIVRLSMIWRIKQIEENETVILFLL